MSTISLIGHLGNDTKVTNLQQDRNVLNFSIAENIKKFDKETGEEINITNWFNCSYFVKSTKVAEYLKKSRRIYVMGKLEFEEYRSTTSSSIQRSNNIIVNDLQIIDFESKEETSPKTKEPSSSDDDLPF